ncbi:MAG: thioredoxin-like domain-containing protein [Planctomycetota bacterium]
MLLSRPRSAFVAGLLGAVLVLGPGATRDSSVAEGKGMSESPSGQRFRAPQLPEGVTWLNTAGPLELSDLRGKFVLFDFWTYCCINCMHVLPELAKLEEAYPKNLVVIGVHSAKFATEKETENITEAILRYKIEHPVINDAEHAVWESYRVSAWPTIVLIDPEGYEIARQGGEFTFDQVDAVLKKAIPYYRRQGLLDETPLKFGMEAQRAEPTPLRFPGKVLADEENDRLFIADSGHNRIVVTRLDGTLVEVIGSGSVGRADGDFASAQFNDPQGMAIQGDTLYLADNRNHMIRKIDLAESTVTTVAGLGHQNREAPFVGMVAPKKTALASPWALWIHGDDLYIAMAGRHQIWKMRLDGSRIGPYAGNGREDIVDGPLLPREPYRMGYSSFAQPSGLASDGDWLYVADSEGSSIRGVPFNPKMEVKTVVGTSRLPMARLFTFGDVDGPPSQALLQHALGIVHYDGRLYVADTYNNKIKVIHPETGNTETLAGTGSPGKSDDPPSFDEPAGLTAAAGKLFVADTNNHLIRIIDLRNGNKVSTLLVPQLEPPAPPTAEKAKFAFPGAAEEKLKPVSVRAEDGQLRLDVHLEFPFGYKVNPLAPMTYQIEAAEDEQPGPVRRASLSQPTRLEEPAAEFAIALPVDTDSGRDRLRVGLTYYYCRDGAEGVCKTGSVVWTVPLELSPDAATAVVPLRHQVR